MSNVPPHPPDDVLTAFLTGRLPEPADDAVAGHLADCPECQTRAAAAGGDDTLVSLLAAAGTRMGVTRAAAPTNDGQHTPADFAATRAWDGVTPAAAPSGPLPPGLADHPRYRLARQIGSGGMGAVWLAEHTVMGRLVALKLIRPEFLARPGAVERFRREVRAAAQLNHPNVATAFDADEAGGTHFLVMEYVPGETLLDAARRGPLPVADACRAVRDAARGLAHAHAAGLVHRDVKPGNLIRTADGTTKVLDFGLVGAGNADGSGLTGENMVMGTPDYIAPEQANDARSADARSDVYSLGCTLYHLLAGRVPFPADSTLQKLDAHRTRDPEPLPGLRPRLAAILARMMAKDPAARYQTAEAVADALAPYCVTLDEPETVALPAEPAPAKPRRGRRWAIAAGVLLGLVGLAAGAAVYKIQRGTETIRVTVDDPDIEIVMKQNGEVVRIVNTKTKESWDLNTKGMRLKQTGGELEIAWPGKEPLKIRRGDKTVVTVERDDSAGEKPIPPADPNLVRTFTGHTGTVRCVAYSPDGKHVLSAGGWPFPDGTVRLWDAGTGKQVWSVNGKWMTNAVAFASNDSALAVGQDGVLRAFDVKTKAVREFERNHSGDVFSVTASPDGRVAFTGGMDGTVRRWDVATGKQTALFTGCKGWVVGVALSPDEKLVAACAGDNIVRIWDAETGKPKFKQHKVPASEPFGLGMRVTRDGRHLLFATGGTVALWNFETGEVVRRLPGRDNKWGGVAVGLSPDERRILVGGNEGDLLLLDAETGKTLREFTGHTDHIWGVAFSPDGRFGLSCSGGRFEEGRDPVLGNDNTVRLWRLPEPPVPIPPAGVSIGQHRVMTGHTKRVRDVAFSPDEATVYSAGDDNCVRVWDRESGKQIALLEHDDWVFGVVVLEDGKTLITNTQKRLWAWDLATGKELRAFPAVAAGDLTSVRASPDGKRVAAGSVSGTVRIWDVAERKLVTAWPGEFGLHAYQTAWSPDGTHLAHGTNERLVVRKVETGELVLSKRTPGTGWLDPAFSPDGNTIAGVMWGGELFLGEIRTGKTVGVLNSGAGRLRFTPDGRLVTAGRGHFVDVWNPTTGARLAELKGHSEQVIAVAVSPDGKWVASGSEDKTVRVWKLPEPPAAKKP